MAPTRREFAAAAAAFTIVPRSVLGGQGHVAPSDRVTLAAIGMGRQGMAVTMDLLARPDVQVVAVCDCNKGSLDYAEYSPNAMLTAARKLLGPGYENWREDLKSPGSVRNSPQKARACPKRNSTISNNGSRKPCARRISSKPA